jgi:radical SAM protein with 4Fe4S-binding SPASM domain
MNKLGRQSLADTARQVLRRVGAKKPQVPDTLNMVVVEVTTYCNLKCSGCVRTIMTDEDTWSNKHMAVADFRKVVDALPRAKLFVPQGIGESTMHPKITELIGIAKASGKFERIEINTNALVRAVDFYATLFDAGLTDLTVSVDTLDPALIEKLRADTDIPKLEARLREFSERFPKRIGVRVTVSKGNVARLPDLFARLSALGKFNVWLQPFFDMGYGAGVLDATEAQSLSANAAEWERDFPNLTITPEPFFPSAEVCPSPWVSPAVTVDGELKPCCMILHQEKISFGDVLKVPFKDLWASEDIEQFRKSFLKKSPDCCARCPYYAFRT